MTDVPRLLAITRARDRLRKTAFRRGQECLPREIRFSREWLEEFRLLRDEELFSPVDQRSQAHSFWGVPVVIEDLGAVALVKFADGSVEPVVLDPQ